MNFIELQRIPEKSTLELVEKVFYHEQQIPKLEIPLSTPNQVWSVIKSCDQVIAAVACWEEAGIWHWGRLVVAPQYRGQGLAKKLAIHSLNHLFETGVGKVHVVARNKTIRLIETLGGKITGEAVIFHGDPITPMELDAESFYLK